MADTAYLVIRDGLKWTDVFRLVPDHAVMIGRAPTNQIVIKDERCSRSHAEVFHSEGEWILRDLESRNGTVVRDQRLKVDYTLRAGDVIRIGRTQLVFVHHLTEAFNEPGSDASPEARLTQDASMTDDSENVLSDYEPTTITHRRVQTRFLGPAGVVEEPAAGTAVSKAGRAAGVLCRLAFELAKSMEIETMANLALAGLFENTATDTGAIHLIGDDGEAKEGELPELEVIASASLGNQPYRTVSNFLTNTVLREGEAVLARHIMGDSSLGRRDSRGVIDATSVLCAPIRQADKVIGLIHLYSTNEENVPDPDDLEFTLAVADTVAVALTNLKRRNELAENLTQIRDENLQLREQLGVASEIIGKSRGLMKVKEEIARAAAAKATVLVRGESGVGKELVSRAVHYGSERKKGPFVCLNCAALAEDLLASELFGHEKGAFTGATDRKIGKFEAADTGTLMLDEIGEMSPAIQAKFLRVLEGHPFERVGGNTPIKCDVRVISATNRDLEKEVIEGRFRRDLYFRLHVLEIVVPPLRKRPEDIHELALYFLQRFVVETGRKIFGYTNEAMERMASYRWPGNVRELKNVVERAVVLCKTPKIEADDLLLSRHLAQSSDTTDVTAAMAASFEPCSLNDVEKKHILATLNHTGWNKSRTAQLLGIERSTLDRKIRRYQLNKDRNKLH